MYYCKKWFCVVLVCILALSGCKKPEKVPALLENNDNSLVEYKAEKRDMETIQYYQGVVTSKTYPASFKKSGEIEKYYALTGEKVTKGEVIGKLVSKELDKDINQKKKELSYINEITNVRISQKELDITEEEYHLKQDNQKHKQERKIVLEELGLEEKKEDLRYEKESKQLSKQQLESELARLEKERDDYLLRAPVSGVVSYVKWDTYNGHVAEGQTVVTINTDEVIITLDQNIDKSKVLDAKSIICNVNGNVYKAGFEINKKRVGTNETEGISFKLKEETDIPLGMIAFVGLVKNQAKDVLTILEDALYSGVSNYFVYQKVDGLLKAVPVEVGLRSNGFVQINKGLEEGDTLYAYSQRADYKGEKEEKVSYGSIQKKITFASGLQRRMFSNMIYQNEEGVSFGHYFAEEGSTVKKGDKLYSVIYPNDTSSIVQIKSDMKKLEEAYKEQKEDIEESMRGVMAGTPEGRFVKDRTRLKKEEARIEYERQKELKQQELEKALDTSGEKIIYAPEDGIIWTHGGLQEGDEIGQNDNYILVMASKEKSEGGLITGGIREDFEELSDKDSMSSFSSENIRKLVFGQKLEFSVGGNTIDAFVSVNTEAENEYKAYREEAGMTEITFFRLEDRNLDMYSLRWSDITATKAKVDKGIVISNEFIECSDDGKRYVYVRKGEHIEKRKVCVGFSDENKSWILYGLEVGETIVLVGGK